MRLRIGLEMGSKLISVVGIEGEKIGMSSTWLGSPSIASLVIRSLGFSRCPPKEFDLRRFLRDPFLRGFELYSLEGLLFNVLPKSASKRSSLIPKEDSKG